MKIDLSRPSTIPSERSLPALIRVGDATFLDSEYSKSRHVSLRDFPDLTGLECFVNHIHIPYHRDRPSLLEALSYVKGLQRSLCSLESDEDFVIVLSVSGSSTVIRFHKNRQGEAWLAPDIERYEEPVGVFNLKDAER
jgi:hypothetical protein